MENNIPTTEEQKAKELFKSIQSVNPNPQLLSSILNRYEVVTKNSTVRIPNQTTTEKRTTLSVKFFEKYIMPWKKIIPIGAAAALLIIAVAYKFAPDDMPRLPKESSIVTNISASPELKSSDIDIATDEIAKDLFFEDPATSDESDLIPPIEEIYPNNLEIIYQPYELEI